MACGSARKNWMNWKQEKRKIKRQIQLADDIIKEDLYTAWYAACLGKKKSLPTGMLEIPGMEEDMLVGENRGSSC